MRVIEEEEERVWGLEDGGLGTNYKKKTKSVFIYILLRTEIPKSSSFSLENNFTYHNEKILKFFDINTPKYLH